MPSLLLLNGSPRGPRSNTMKMLARVKEGWELAGGGPSETLHLAQPADFARALAAIGPADTVLLGMPLYTDAMPALVLAFFEGLASRAGAARLGFLVQSGFPEALHSRPLERYLEKLARRLGSRYAGTIVRGAGESLRAMPEQANRKLWARLRTLGGQLAREGRFAPDDLRAVAGIERFPRLAAALLGLVFRLSVTQFYWNRQLKRNGAWSRRFAQPYAFRGPCPPDFDPLGGECVVMRDSGMVDKIVEKPGAPEGTTRA